MKTTIAILAAMDCEIDEFLVHAEVIKELPWNGFMFRECKLSGRDVVLVKCGVGKVLSAMVAQHLIDAFQPREILFTGLAGSLNPAYAIGDIVVSKDCVQHDMDAELLGFKRGQIPFTDIRIVPADKNLNARALSYQASGHKVYSGRIITGDQFMSHASKDSHRYLTQELEGDAVDMEGASVGTVAMLNKIPFLIIRTISDRADSDAHVDMSSFMPLASKNSFGMIEHLLF